MLDIVILLLTAKRYWSSEKDGISAQKELLALLLPILKHPRSVVRKRAIAALAALGVVASEETFNELSATLMQLLKESDGDVATVVGCLASLSRDNHIRLQPNLAEIVTRTLGYAKADDGTFPTLADC